MRNASVNPAPAAESPSGVNARSIAAEIIARWLTTEDFPDRLLADVASNRAFIMEVVYGVARRRRSLEWVIGMLVERPAPAPLQACLLVGAYQLLFMDTVPAHAAVHASVEAAKQAGGQRAAGFVNRILRSVAAGTEVLRRDLEAQPLGVRESFPDELLRRWIRTFGRDRTETLCRWQNQRANVTIHLDPARTTAAALLEAFRAGGVAAVPHPFRPAVCLVLPHGVNVTRLPGFSEGLFSVQDPATLAAVDLLAPQPGERVLDACAAPGGKTVLLAAALRGSGELVAMDLHADRLAPLRENVERMRIPVRIVQGDARIKAFTEPLGPEPFDKILIDAPCTNTGVLGRRPDARWRFTPQRLKKLTQTQRALLENLARLVRPGGALVYSTCSLEPEENQALVDDWLSRHTEFTLGRAVTLFPPETKTDGAFAALLKRRPADG